MTKVEIISKLKELKPLYEREGLTILGVFGSYAKSSENKYSDIDIAYHINYETFSKKYRDGFSKLLRIEEIHKELQKIFKIKVDFVPDNNKKIIEDIIYV